MSFSVFSRPFTMLKMNQTSFCLNYQHYQKSKCYTSKLEEVPFVICRYFGYSKSLMLYRCLIIVTDSNYFVFSYSTTAKIFR